jgi:hypothetical protein
VEHERDACVAANMNNRNRGHGTVHGRAHILIALLLSAAANPAVANELQDARDAIDAEFAQQIAGLANKCDKLGLKEQAAVTRSWPIKRAGDRQYLFVPLENDPVAVGADPPDLVRKWYDRFRQIRGQHADALFNLARKHLDAGQITKAYQLAYEAVRENPDHEEARTAIGYRMVNGRWRRPGLPRRTRRPTVGHAKIGWPAGAYYRIDTAHFEIVTNTTPEQGNRFADQLEDLHTVWRQLFVRFWTNEASLDRWFAGKAIIAPPRLRHKMVLFKNRADYLETLRPVQPQIDITLGYYLPADKLSFFYMDETGANDASVFHEVTHQLFQETGRNTENPGERHNFWAVEAVALYMESMQRRQGYYMVGGVESPRLQYARNLAYQQRRNMPLEQLCGGGRVGFQTSEDVRRLYSLSSGWGHFLMDGEQGRLRDPFLAYLQLIYADKDNPQTITRATDLSFAELEKRYVEFLKIDDDDLANIPRDSRIKRLTVIAMPVTDRGLLALPSLEHLEWFDASGTAVTDKGIAKLAEASRLKNLGLEHTRVTDASLPMIGKLAALESLDLSNTWVTDEGVAHLAALNNLDAIWLTGARVTDNIFEPLGKLPELTYVNADRTGVTAAAYEAFMKARKTVEPSDE